MAIIRAGIGSWSLPISRHKTLRPGDHLKVSLTLEPFLCVQETNEQHRMTSLSAFLYEIHGVVSEVNEESWVLWCGLPLLCQQKPYPWLFKGQELQVFGKLIMHMDEARGEHLDVTVQNISSQLQLFKHLQVDQNKPIMPGASTNATRQSIANLRGVFPVYEVEEIPFPLRTAKLDFFCFDLEYSPSLEKRNFY